MMHWRDIALTILGFLKLTDRPTEEELIEHGRELERQDMQKRTYVWIDPTVRVRGYEQSAWNSPPERTTGPVQGIRRRAMSREFQAHPGILMRHENAMRKKAQTRQLDPETVQLPTVPQPRKLHFQRLYAEPDSTFNAL